MHELSIAATIMQDVLQVIKARDLGKVLSVRLRVGELTCVQPEQLKFCYESITQETPLQDSKLEIEEVRARVICRQCGYRGPPKYWMDCPEDLPLVTLQCPTCGKAAEAEEGRECAITSLQYAA
jgi:hydrogenase nickel incorporation protein HypA/HybF